LRTCLAGIATASARCSAAGLADDCHGYADEDARIMAAVGRHVTSIVEGKGTGNVVSLR
jgi:hypothetical protein